MALDVVTAGLALGDDALKAALTLQAELNTQAEIAAKTAREIQTKLDLINYLIAKGTPDALLEIQKLAAG